MRKPSTVLAFSWKSRSVESEAWTCRSRRCAHIRWAAPPAGLDTSQSLGLYKHFGYLMGVIMYMYMLCTHICIRAAPDPQSPTARTDGRAHGRTPVPTDMCTCTTDRAADPFLCGASHCAPSLSVRRGSPATCAPLRSRVCAASPAATRTKVFRALHATINRHMPSLSSLSSPSPLPPVPLSPRLPAPPRPPAPPRSPRQPRQPARGGLLVFLC